MKKEVFRPNQKNSFLMKAIKKVVEKHNSILARPIQQNAYNPLEHGRKDDAGKPRMELIPPLVLIAVAKILTFGASKYGVNNWQNLDNFRERYTGALMRHLESWRAGEDIDPESGQPHLAHLVCNGIFLLWDYLTRLDK